MPDEPAAAVESPAGSAHAESALVRALQREVKVLRQQLAQRDHAFTVLNRRLMALQRGEGQVTGPDRAQAGAASAAEVDELRGELTRLRSTKLFRWSSPARQVYGKVRRLIPR